MLGEEQEHDSAPRAVARETSEDGEKPPTRSQKDLSFRLALGGAAFVLGAVVCVGLALAPRSASALPSYAMQTGQPCSACHTAFPELTPYGREFKLNGYTAGGGLPFPPAPPIAVMIQGPQFEHFDKNLDAPPTSDTHTNNNVVLSQLSLFYGGKIFGNIGAFIQGTYDGVGHTWSIDNTDIRYADTAKLFGSDLVWGVDVNNNPTVQDVWNTTPAWGLPYISRSHRPRIYPPRHDARRDLRRRGCRRRRLYVVERYDLCRGDRLSDPVISRPSGAWPRPHGHFHRSMASRLIGGSPLRRRSANTVS